MLKKKCMDYINELSVTNTSEVEICGQIQRILCGWILSTSQCQSFPHVSPCVTFAWQVSRQSVNLSIRNVTSWSLQKSTHHLSFPRQMSLVHFSLNNTDRPPQFEYIHTGKSSKGFKSCETFASTANAYERGGLEKSRLAPTSQFSLSFAYSCCPVTPTQCQSPISQHFMHFHQRNFGQAKKQKQKTKNKLPLKQVGLQLETIATSSGSGECYGP